LLRSDSEDPQTLTVSSENVRWFR